MAPRAIWKGFLKIDELVCPVALYSAATTSERISFHTVNAKTGNRVKREYVDAESGKPVEREDQVKGYETSKDQYILLEPEEIAATVPDGDKTLSVEAFVECPEVDTVFFDKPYYIAPSDAAAEKAFGVIREGMRAKKVAALARAVLFRRVRTVLIRPDGNGLIGNTLNFDYEVRSAEKVFDGIPAVKVKGEMLDLAKYIIETKTGMFDPAEYDDRYDAAVAELVKAKLEGRPMKPQAKRPEGKVVDLMEALRKSAQSSGTKSPAEAKKTPARRKAVPDAPKRKAG